MPRRLLVSLHTFDLEWLLAWCHWWFDCGGGATVIIADYAWGIMQTGLRSSSGNSKLVQQQRFAGVYVTMAQQLGEQPGRNLCNRESADAVLSGRQPTRATHQRIAR